MRYNSGRIRMQRAVHGMLACTIVYINVTTGALDPMLLVYEDESLSCSFASMQQQVGHAIIIARLRNTAGRSLVSA